MALTMVLIFGANMADLGILGTDPIGDVLGGAGLAVLILLLLGWWGRNQQAAEWGMAGAFAVMLFRALAILLTFPTNVIGWGLSLTCAVAAGGSLLLEIQDPQGLNRGNDDGTAGC